MAVIAVDPQGLVDCAGQVARAQGDLIAAADAAAAGLAGSGGMAGNDPAGTDWSAAYDPAAARLLGLAADIGNRLGEHVHALNGSAAAYHATESWFGGSPPPPPLPAQAWPASVARSVPETKGGVPFGHADPIVQAVLALVGTVWPNGSTERLRAAAAQWSNFAMGIDTARTTALVSAAGTLATMNGPMASAAADRTRTLDTGLHDLATGATELSTACGDLASHIEGAHREAEREIVDLLRDAAITAAVSAGLSFVTFGAGALIGGAAATVRVTATAGRLASLFQRLASLARAVAARIGKIKVALDGLAARMSQWVMGRLPQPMRRLGEAAEKVTDHWLFTLATDGPFALAGKLAEKPIAALAGKAGEAGARRALVLGWNRSSAVRTAIARTAGAGTPPGPPPLSHAAARMPTPDSGEPGSVPPAGSVVPEAMRRGENTTLARMMSGSKEPLTQAVGKILPKPEENPPREPEGESHRPRIADVLGLPEGAWMSLDEPGPISPVPGVTVDVAAGKVTGPAGLKAELTLPGEAGSQLSAVAKLARAATLEGNYWGDRFDAAARVGDVQFTFGQAAAQAMEPPAEADAGQPALLGR